MCATSTGKNVVASSLEEIELEVLTLHNTINVRATVERAKRIGELLLSAKARLPHGEYVLSRTRNLIMARPLRPARTRRLGRLDSPLQLVALEDRITPVIDLVSINLAGTAAGNGRTQIGPGGGSRDQQLSADGRFVVLVSLATDLTAEAEGGSFDIYVRDTILDTTELVTRTLSGKTGGGSGQRITTDGRYVLYTGSRSEGPNGFVPAGTFTPVSNGGGHVYRRDLQTDTTELAASAPTASGVRAGAASPATPTSATTDGTSSSPTAGPTWSPTTPTARSTCSSGTWWRRPRRSSAAPRPEAWPMGGPTDRSSAATGRPSFSVPGRPT